MKKKLYPSTIFSPSTNWLATLAFCLALCWPPTMDAQEPIFLDTIQDPFGLVTGNVTTLVKLADIDHDNTLEAFVSIGGPGTGNVHYYKNNGSNAEPDFVFQEADPFGLTYEGRRPWQFVDIDGDGLDELFMAGFLNDIPVHMIEITENAAGEPDFSGEPLINPYGITLPVSDIDGSLLDATFPTFTDIDNDGDYDLFLGGWFNNGLPDEKLFFMENKDSSGTGTAPRFDSIQVNPFGFDFPLGENVYLLTFADLNCDSLPDLYIGSVPNNDVYYFENVGDAEVPDFSLGVSSAYAFPFMPPGGSFLDIGDDGDLDLINGSPGLGIQYYEHFGEKINPCIVNVREDEVKVRVGLAPNPVQDQLQLTLRSQMSMGNAKLEIFDSMGRKAFTRRVRTVGNEVSETFDVSQLPPGLYFLKIGLGEKALTQKFVKSGQ